MMHAPEGLSPEAKRKWKKTVEKHKLFPSDPEVLQIALESWDIMQDMKKILKKYGYVIRGKDGSIKRNPAATILKESRQAFLRAWRDLGLQGEADTKRSVGRPSDSERFKFEYAQPNPFKKGKHDGQGD